jgi:hypothetical protein
MAIAIPPPHVPLAPNSSYLLDALVPVPLPFLFLSPASSLYGGLFHLFLGLFVPLFGSSGFRRFIALRLRQVFYVPPPRHSLIATFLNGVPARSRLSLLRFTDLLCVCFVVLHPLPGLFPRLHRVELLTRPSVYGVYLHVIGFIFLYFFLFLLVISLVSISLLWGVMLDPDLWVVDVNVILAFGRGGQVLARGS